MKSSAPPIGAGEGISFWRRLPRPLKIVFGVALGVGGYGLYTWFQSVRVGLSPNGTSVSVYGFFIPYFDPTATASAILALATAALAYSAVRQAGAAEELVKVSREQAEATRKQTMILDTQYRTERDLAEAARTAALRESAIRRSESFPRVRIVTPTGPGEAEWVTIMPGNLFRQGSEPIIGIENQGKGPAVDLRVAAAWKVFDFDGAKTASPETLEKVRWEPVPQWVPPIDVLDPGKVVKIETVFWLSAFVVSSRQTRRIVALFVKPSWRNPDGEREQSAGRGLVLIPGGFSKTMDVTWQEVVSFVGIGPDQAPSEDSFSKEPPL